MLIFHHHHFPLKQPVDIASIFRPRLPIPRL